MNQRGGVDRTRLASGRETLESPLDSKEIKPVNPKYSLERLMLKLQYFGCLV